MNTKSIDSNSTSDCVGNDLPPARPMVHTIKGFIVHETWKGDREGRYLWQSARAIKDSTLYTQVDVCEHELTFEIPAGFDPRPAQIKALREEQQKVRAAMALRIKELDDQINSLLALEMS